MTYGLIKVKNLTQRKSREVNSERNVPDVMIRIDANGIGLEVECVMAAVGATQLVLVEVRPTPNSRVNHVGKTFATCDLFSFHQNNVSPNSFQLGFELESLTCLAF